MKKIQQPYGGKLSSLLFLFPLHLDFSVLHTAVVIIVSFLCPFHSVLA